MRSAGFRYLVVGLLTLLMVIPLFLAGAIIDDRSSYARQTRAEVGREWGGPQTVTGPVLVVPVEGEILREERRERTDAQGQPAVEVVPVRTRGAVAPLVLLPEALEASVDTQTDIRRRGIFEVPVYTAELRMTARFDPARLEGALGPQEVAQWGGAVLRLGLTGNAGLRGAATIDGPDGPLTLEPYAAGRGSGGIDAGPVFDPAGPASAAGPRAASFDVALTLNGAQSLLVAPVGRDTALSMAGDWPDPSFTGAFLPDSYEVSEDGYAARWTVPHLARTLPQVGRGAFTQPGAFAFGTEFVQLNDFYQKAFRAARYGILFIALTFLTVLLIERRGAPTHPVQYILIGLAQCIFVLLMVAYAEQIGFTPAYLLAAGATTALLTLFGSIGLKLGRRAFVMGGLLVVLYAVLYLILRSTDLALLAGATLAFGALALTMVMTRDESWYGEAGPGRGLRGQAKAASSATSTMSPKVD